MNGVTVASTKPSRRLVLHFDINKTIVMKDTSNNLNNTTLTVRTSLSNFEGLRHVRWTLLGTHVC